jgi:hypothetical protein
LVLLAIGGLNRGLVGLFGFNAVSTIFGTVDALIHLTYTIIGIADVYTIVRMPAITHVLRETPHTPHPAWRGIYGLMPCKDKV